MNHIILKDCEDLYKERTMDWSRLKNASVLITGACGMLPAYMVWMLVYLNEYQNFHIRILALCRDAVRAEEVFGAYIRRDYFELVLRDVAEPMEIEGELDYIIHAASPSGSQYFGTDPVGVILPNVMGTFYTLELAKEKGVKGYLYFSSSEIYGKIEKEAIEETDCGYLDSMEVRNCYGESKRLGENICKAYSSQHGVHATVVRPAHTYGPTMNLKKDKRVYAGFVSNILHHEDLLIMGDGFASRNFCYIYDAVFGYFKVLLDGKAGEAYNVSNPACQSTIRDLAELLVELFPEKKLQIAYANHDAVYLENPYKKQSAISVDKLKGLGWTPRVSLKEGFRRTVESFGEKEIAIYGARMVAMSVYRAIRELYPECRIAAFLVSDKKGNSDFIDGIPVMALNDFDRQDIKVLIAAQDNYHKEIAKALEEKGLKDYIKIDGPREAKLMERYYKKAESFTFLHDLRQGEKRADVAVYISKFHRDRPVGEACEMADWMYPIQSGAELTNCSVCDLKDNMGENISKRNGNYSELSSMYWIGKHGEAEYLGLFHYRRLLELSEEDLYRLSENKVDVVLAYPAVYYPNIMAHHQYYLNEGDWNAMKQALEELEPEYAAAMPEIFREKYFYNHNILIARKEIFKNYCNWLFPILERTEELSVPKGKDRADRYIGYLGENLTTLYFMYHKRELNIVYTGRRMLL